MTGPLGIADSCHIGLAEGQLQVSCKALSFRCASTAFLSKTTPFLAVCLSCQRPPKVAPVCAMPFRWTLLQSCIPKRWSLLEVFTGPI
eukprot:SAG22_NODE_3519_length_1666_cov_1.324186_1_plen_87_part_10